MGDVSDESGPAYSSALQDFWRARRRATLRQVLGTLTRSSAPLMNFEEVRRKLRAVEGAGRVLREVPLNRIVGSVGRYNDFTREFLPRQDSDKSRWAGVRMAMTGMTGVPPVELYSIGDAYFVRDGNHRVSVARQLGSRYIQAWVTPLHTRVHLAADTSPDELIIKAEEVDFLEKSQIDELRPGADLRVTAPGQYVKLLEHISVHRYFMGLDEQREVSEAEAVTHFYDTVYLPVKQQIEELDLLKGFEGRTVTDLYLWLSEHRGRLWRELGFRLPTGAVAEGLARRNLAASPASRKRLLHDAASGTGPGLYRDILVGLPNTGEDRQVFAKALSVAKREDSALYVLLVDGGLTTQDAPVELQGDLHELALRAGVDAQFVLDRGNPAEELLERAQYSDLVVLGNNRRVQPIVRRCPQPLLLVRGDARETRHVLLAFDGGRRSEEAMFHAAYLQLAWGLRLSVVTVAATPAAGERVLDKARAYLEGVTVKADYLVSNPPVVPGLLATAERLGCDTIALGSYKYSAWLETVLGGVPDDLIAQASQNLLIV